MNRNHDDGCPYLKTLLRDTKNAAVEGDVTTGKRKS
jgi:hypothetical protein